MLKCPASWGFSSVVLVPRSFRPNRQRNTRFCQRQGKMRDFYRHGPSTKVWLPIYYFWRFQNYLRRKVRIERMITIQKKPTSLEDATQSSNNVPCSSSLSLSPLPDLVWAMSSRQVVESHREDWPGLWNVPDIAFREFQRKILISKSSAWTIKAGLDRQYSIGTIKKVRSRMISIDASELCLSLFL